MLRLLQARWRSAEAEACDESRSLRSCERGQVRRVCSQAPRCSPPRGAATPRLRCCATLSPAAARTIAVARVGRARASARVRAHARAPRRALLVGAALAAARLAIATSSPSTRTSSRASRTSRRSSRPEPSAPSAREPGLTARARLGRAGRRRWRGRVRASRSAAPCASRRELAGRSPPDAVLFLIARSVAGGSAARGEAHPVAELPARVRDRARGSHDPGDALRGRDDALRPHRRRRQCHQPDSGRSPGRRRSAPSSRVPPASRW